MCVSRDKKYSLFGKFGVLSFLDAPVLRLALLPYYYRRYYVWIYAYIDCIENMDYVIFQACLNNFVRNFESLQNLSFLIFEFFYNYLLTSSFIPLIVL